MQPSASDSHARKKENTVIYGLEGQTAAVTGGDQGIGRAIVERLAQDGADIGFCYRSHRAGADETVAAVTALGRKAAARQADGGNGADGRRVISAAIAPRGKSGILVDSAGLAR